MILSFISFHIASAQSYQTLEPISGFVGTNVNTGDLSGYLNSMFKLGIALAVGLAVVMIILGGIQYMSTDAIGKKEDGKKRITAAIVGLLVALGSYMLLNTLSPDLLSTKLTLTNVSVQDIHGGVLALYPGDANYPYQPSDPRYGNPVNAGSGGTNCTVNNGTASFDPKLTAYSPQGAGSTMEGGYASSRPGLDGQSVVRTLDDVANGKSTYVTLAGDPSQYGKTYEIPSITYKNSSGQTVTLKNVTGYVHDTGSAFTGAGTSHYDVAIGRDYSGNIINSQPFTGGNTPLTGCTPSSG